MVISELSFQSVSPLPSLSFFSHQITFKNSVSQGRLASKLGQIANQLRRNNQNILTVSYPKDCSLISSIELTGNEKYTIENVTTIDITHKQYRRSLEEILNHCFSSYFKNRGRRIDFYKRKVFLEITYISQEIEAQRFLSWAVRINSDNYIMLVMDYGNEYYSRYTLDKKDLSTLLPDQPLSHIYDGSNCRYVDITDKLVSDILPELGNISLLDYHRNNNKISADILKNIPPDTKAIRVNYGSKGKDYICFHIPHLLKKTFTKDDVNADDFNKQMLSVNDRFKRSIETIETLNSSGGITLNNHTITFKEEPYKPEYKFDFTNTSLFEGSYKNNLDFGNGLLCSYPTQGLDRKKLLEKPDKISSIVFYPNNWSVQSWCQKFSNFLKDFKIQLDITEFRPYPIDNTLEIKRQCRNLNNSEFILMFVPDKDEFINNRLSDPYPTLKREFVKSLLPSQGIEKNTLEASFDKYTNYNIMLGILGKLGYSPWKLRYLPGTAQAFLGLDIGRKNGKAVGMAAFIVSPQGKVIGWFPANFQAHKETFEQDILHDIIFNLVNLYEEKNQTKLNHLVIHRDGTFQNQELNLLKNLLPELKQAGVKKVDAAEILKSGYPRAAILNNQSQKWENPRRGQAWRLPNNYYNEVAIMTTGKTELKGGKNVVPRPIIVRRRLGSTSPIELAAQVYWLSEMHIGSTQTVRLPITTYYADKAAEYALEGLLPSGLQKGSGLPL